MIRRALRHLAHQHNRCVGLYRRICRPDGTEWAAYLRRHGGLYSMGGHCFIEPNVVITDPAYTRIGNNVRLSGCTIFGHDGSVNMLNRAYGLTLDKVGRVVIEDDVFIGHGAIVLPGVFIGSKSIIGAGAVMTRSVMGSAVYGGVPAKELIPMNHHLRRAQQESDAYPWAHLIDRRGTAYDAGVQPELDRLRVAHFFGAAAELTS